MKIAGLSMNNVWAQRVLQELGEVSEQQQNIEADIGVFVESIELNHHGPQMNYRPYLHLSGELQSVRPHKTLLYDVDDIQFPVGSGEMVDVYYEFDDQQLVELARKGYFSSDFTVPRYVTGIEWELPAKVDTLQADLPIVFVRVHDLGNLAIDRESSGYDLTEYFADQFGKPREHDVVKPELSMQARSDTINPLFDESVFDQTQQAKDTALLNDVVFEEDTLTHQVETVNALLDAEEEQRIQDRAELAGTVENLYRSRVANILEHTLDQESTVDKEYVNMDQDGKETGFTDRLGALKQEVSQSVASLNNDEEETLDDQPSI